MYYSFGLTFSFLIRQFFMVGWLCWGLKSQSTIFQSCRDGAIASWVINQYFRGVKCLAQGHNTAAVGLEPRTSRSGVRHSTTEPPRSPIFLWCVTVCFASFMSWYKSRSTAKPTNVRPSKTQISLSYQSSPCTLWVAKDPNILQVDREDWSTGQMPGLKWVFAGFKGHCVGFVVLGLIFDGILIRKVSSFCHQLWKIFLQKKRKWELLEFWTLQWHQSILNVLPITPDQNQQKDINLVVAKLLVGC